MTTILTAQVARFGNEKHRVRLYDAGGGGWEEFLGTMPLEEFCDVVVRWSGNADFVCVDQTGLGAALVDMLKARGVTALVSGSGRVEKGPEQMTLDTAIHILTEIYTGDDSEVGYLVRAGIATFQFSRYSQVDMIKAWGVLREHDRRPTKPEDYK